MGDPGPRRGAPHVLTHTCATFRVHTPVFRISFSARAQGQEYFAGYLLEQSLSIDNLFVFILVFNYFQTPPALQKKVRRDGWFARSQRGRIKAPTRRCSTWASGLQRFSAPS